ncbi:MAG: DNA primase [Holophagales bacterium]|nr:DNA primase [Holophagales bacterium]
MKADVVRWDLGRILRSLEELQRKALAEALKPSTPAHVMTEEERAEALELLTSEDLVSRILADYEAAAPSARRPTSSSATSQPSPASSPAPRRHRPLQLRRGQDGPDEAVLALVPKEDREKYSALSEHSLFYFEGKDFKNKILAIVEEEGAQKAAYALKLLQSEGEITIASTGKDPGTGKLVTKEYHVEGPVMIILATTAVEVDEELLNRAIVLTVDEGREQTRRIHKLQRESQTLEGLFSREEREEIYRRHHNAQRLLRPLHVINPYVRELTFLDDRTRTRRDHVKYLTLIESIALLHQYQRSVKAETRFGRTKEYIEVLPSDIVLANRLAAEVLGRSLDELPPQTRRLLELLDGMVTETAGKNGVERADLRFTIRDIRRATGWSHDQVWRHMQRLVFLEYVLVHRGGRGQSFVYELLYDGQGRTGSPSSSASATPRPSPARGPNPCVRPRLPRARRPPPRVVSGGLWGPFGGLPWSRPSCRRSLPMRLWRRWRPRRAEMEIRGLS